MSELKGECVEWKHGRTRGGYGVFRAGGKAVFAHRHAYCEANRQTLEDIAGKVVRHKCDNPPCINPDHLEIGTHMDNVHDAIKRGRARYAMGEQSSGARLTEGQVRAMHQRCQSGELYARIAKDFDVDPSTVCDIANGRIWSHLGLMPVLRGRIRGEKANSAKLNEDKVRDIRRRIDCGEPISSIARRYEVHRASIQAIRSGRSWSHVVDPLDGRCVTCGEQLKAKEPWREESESEEVENG